MSTFHALRASSRATSYGSVESPAYPLIGTFSLHDGADFVIRDAISDVRSERRQASAFRCSPDGTINPYGTIMLTSSR